MKLQEIMTLIREKKSAPLYVDFPMGGQTHFIQVLKRSLTEVLVREFAPQQETGKTIYYNDDHDSLYLECNPVISKDENVE